MYSEGWMPAHQPQQVHARFECEPPADLRKSNFFQFRVELRAENGAPLDVVCARFLHFLNEDHPQDGNHQLRNGIKYSITLKYSNGMTESRELYLTLVDANTREIIRYEGHDDNPKMQRVLLTHEAICTRCSLNKSCGNKNEAPSDPVIAGRGILKFFLKCNQNCLKGAGNPRDTRRFALAVSLGDCVTLSQPMFVHNNSKHSRNKRKREGARISHVVGPGIEGKLVVVGENFREGDRLFVDDQAALKIVHHSENMMEAWLGPPTSIASTCRVTLQSGEDFLDAGTIQNPSVPLACVKSCLFCFEFVSPRWTVPNVSFTYEHLPLRILSMVPRHMTKVELPRSLNPGYVTICVLWNERPQFTFPLRVLYKTEWERQTPDLGITCLYSKRNSPEWAFESNLAVFVEEVDVKPSRAHWGYPDGAYYDPNYSSSSPDAALHSSPPL